MNSPENVTIQLTEFCEAQRNKIPVQHLVMCLWVIDTTMWLFTANDTFE